MSTVRKIRWFWSWNDSQEENWLRDMSAQGLHLKKVEPPCFYTFERGSPADYVYKMDYQANVAALANTGWFALAPKSTGIKEADAEYYQLFQDAGWEYLGTNRGWRYFRHTNMQSQVQELYTDQASKQAKYRRQIIFQLALVVLVAIFSLNPSLNESLLTAPWNILGFAIVLVFAIPLLPLWWRLNQLRKQI